MQSFAADEQYATNDVISPARSISRRSTRRSGRGRSGSVGSEGEGAERQDSVLAKQLSVSNAPPETKQLKRLASKAQQEEWDKEIPEVGVVVGGAGVWLWVELGVWLWVELGV